MFLVEDTELALFDEKEVTDAIYGISAEEDYSTFMRGRDLRRKAMPGELKKNLGVEVNYNSFCSFKRNNF